ncbi:MAG: hypothetical protein ACOVNL_04695 [Prochlorococcaceae cyanobacterium]|jgi:hypothetical protein
MRPLAGAVALLLLGAGGAPSGARAQGSGPEPVVVRTVPPQATPDPVVEKALRQALFQRSILDAEGHGPDPGSKEARQASRRLERQACEQAGSLRYAYDGVDLDPQGGEEVVATVLGPMVCGTGGCPLLIFRREGKGLSLVTRMTLFKDPLIVTDQRSRGWRDLVSRVRIDAGHGYYARLPFDGRSYPTNPSTPPAEPLREPVRGSAHLGWREGGAGFHPLPCSAKP